MCICYLCLQKLTNMDLVLEDKNKDAGVVIVIESGQKQPKDKYMNNSVKALSILHIVLGILSCSVCFYELFYISYHPYGSRLISTIGEGIFLVFHSSSLEYLV